MANFLLSDNSSKLGTPRRPDGKVGRLRVEWNEMRKAVGFSGQTQSGEWVNAYLMFSEFVTLCDDIKVLMNTKEETFYDCGVHEGRDQVFKFRIGAGRDADGIIYLEIGEPQKEALRFLFLPEKQYRRTVNGQPMSPNELSRRRASGWIQTVMPVISKIAGEAQAAEKNGGGFQKKQWGNGNNYQKKPWQGNGGGNKGYQNKPWNNGNGNNYGGNGGQNGGNGNQAPVADGSLDEYLTL